MYGKVTPPKDLGPAIEALTDKGREFLQKETKGRKITPPDIARAADYERGELIV
jgi:hypothetical protein